ncbi:1-phosphofructokinase family hexose kinase [Enterococcus sp. CWB-B31]|uniref:1-phosphofructokinase family hexose kinase n=1 Tax=Enterococcus sp. CWB-B31 TaxID=2885159 RepID=UPI001E61C24E|nr:1-phosphofructokinase family hexose kinase [Enterococcus sp. CWB-B31]MCB5953579.1 1-phosphofructokinase family hexose kinase [Enterococcus sp. CWB-B31]
MIYTITLNPAIDRLVFLEKHLSKRKTNRAAKVTYDIGGKGTHGSYAMSRLGIPNLALGFAGEKNLEKFEQVLEQKNISHLFLKIPDEQTRESIVIIEPNNQGTTMLTEPGFLVPESIKNELLAYLEEQVTAEDVVLIAGSLPENFNLSDLEKLIIGLKGKNCFIACDLSGEALVRAVDLGVDFIKPNEFELTELLLSEEGSADYALNQLAQKITCVVASKGELGSICCYEGKRYQVKAPKVNEVNDTGAGDCFVGAFLAAFSKDWDIEAALKTGSACAASKVQYEDSSYFDPVEAEQLMSQVELTVCQNTI